MYLLVSGFLVSLITVGLFSMYMTVSWPVVAGTQFTAYMAILNLSTTIGQWTSGWINEWGVSAVFMIFAGVQVLVIVLLPFIDVQQTRRVLGDNR